MRFPALKGTSALMLLLAAALTVWASLADRAEPNPARAAEPVTNSIGMKLVRIPAGEFLMGSPEGPDELARTFTLCERRRLEALDDERPAHRVRITRAFYLGAHEVTLAQFKQFVRDAGYRTEAERDDGGWGYNPRTQKIEGRRRE